MTETNREVAAINMQESNPLYCHASEDHQHEIDMVNLQLWINMETHSYTVTVRCTHCYAEVRAEPVKLIDMKWQ